MASLLTPATLVDALRKAIVLHNQGQLDAADAIYREVLALAPRHADALHLRALVAHAQGDFAAAAELAEAAVAAAPRVANLRNTAGDARRRLGELLPARRHLEEAVRLAPAMAMAWHNLALVCLAAGSLSEAQGHNRRALEFDPDHREALLTGLSIACDLDDHVMAAQLAGRLRGVSVEPAVRTALAIHHCYLARRHLAGGDIAAGEGEARRALETDAGFWGGWGMLGEAAYQHQDFDRAELACSIAVNLAPRNRDARGNLATLLVHLKRIGDARAHLRGLLAEFPDDATARFNLGCVALMQGDYAAGWADYEARWGVPGHRQARYALAPQWQGEAVGRLLLYAEQGLGDTLQMLRFLPEARRRAGGGIVLQVGAPLARLVARACAAYAIRVVAEIPDQGFDAACPLLSLPHVLQANSALRIGMGEPYLSAGAERIAEFQALLAKHPGRKLGLVWRGAEGSAANRLRVLPEDALECLLDIPGWTPVSLQFGVREPAIAGVALLDLAGEIADFDDLAAAMMAVDAVVSLDTGPAHLAGALGLPVQVLLPWLHDWRWGAAGERCDWYPQAKLHRQALGGDWLAPLARLRGELEGLAVPAAAAQAGIETSIAANAYPLVAVRCREGLFHLPLADPDVGRSLLVYGEHAVVAGAVIARLLAPGQTVIDVGAGLGAASIAFARAVGEGGRVLAIEADPLLHRCLAATISDNGLASVTTRCATVTRATFHDARESGPAKAIRLDELGLRACRLLRIARGEDAVAVLDGGASLLRDCRPLLWIEAESAGEVWPLAERILRLGYTPHIHEAALFVAENHRACPYDMFSGRSAVTLVGLPDGAPAPDGLRPLPVRDR